MGTIDSAHQPRKNPHLDPADPNNPWIHPNPSTLIESKDGKSWEFTRKMFQHSANHPNKWGNTAPHRKPKSGNGRSWHKTRMRKPLDIDEFAEKCFLEFGSVPVVRRNQVQSASESV